ALFRIDLAETHFDDFRLASLHGAADKLGFNRHFAMAAVDEHAERNALRAAEIEETVHGGADGAAGVKDVVDEDEVHAIHAESNVGGLENSLGRDFREVVAIKRNIQRADGDIDAVDTAHGLRYALCQRYAAATDADQGEMLGAATLLDNLMGQASQGAVDLRGGHQLGFFDDAHGRVILAQASGACRQDRHSYLSRLSLEMYATWLAAGRGERQPVGRQECPSYHQRL